MPFSGLPGRVAETRDRIEAALARGGRGQQVRIVAVTKTLGPDAAEAAYRAGVTDIGENKVQEALRKMQSVTVPVSWHLVGHLQRNKVKDCTRFAMIHSLDSTRLAEALSRFGTERSAPVEVLVQVNASREATKSGMDAGDVPREAERLRELSGVRVKGVMVMAALDAPEPELRRTFGVAREARDALRAAGNEDATELSMGMSQDYEIAVEEGATIVRLGTILFGPRETR